MKRHCVLWLILIVSVCLSACIQRNQDQEKGIEGVWETSANVINDGSSDLSFDGVIRYCFNADMSGTLITYANGISHQSDFIYSFSECNIQIDFGEEPVWSFPYKLDGDTLMLIQNNCEVIYVRAE